MLANRSNDDDFSKKLLYLLERVVDDIFTVPSDDWFDLISVLRPFNTFSGAVSYPNHTVPGQASYAIN